MVLQKGIDNALYDPFLPEYAAVKAAVDAAIAGDLTVGAAVENAGLYQTLTTPQATEARAVFAAMPPSLNKAILAALSSAFARGLVIRVNWVEITQGLMHAHFEESADKKTLLVQLWTRDGTTYLTGTRRAARRDRDTNWVAEMHAAGKRTAKKRPAAKRAPAKRTAKKRTTASRAPAKRTAKKRTAAKRAPAKRTAKKRVTRRR